MLTLEQKTRWNEFQKDAEFRRGAAQACDRDCVFYSDEFKTCDFDVMRKFISAERSPRNCMLKFYQKGAAS